MAKDSIKDRIKITKNGKVKRRAPGQSHAKGNKTSKQKGRNKRERDLDMSENKVKELIHEQ